MNALKRAIVLVLAVCCALVIVAGPSLAATTAPQGSGVRLYQVAPKEWYHTRCSKLFNFKRPSGPHGQYRIVTRINGRKIKYPTNFELNYAATSMTTETAIYAWQYFLVHRNGKLVRALQVRFRRSAPNTAYCRDRPPRCKTTTVKERYGRPVYLDVLPSCHDREGSAMRLVHVYQPNVGHAKLVRLATGRMGIRFISRCSGRNFVYYKVRERSRFHKTSNANEVFIRLTHIPPNARRCYP